MAVTIVIHGTEDVLHADDAAAFCRAHVVIRKDSLDAIGKRARELGLIDEFKKLEATVHEMSPRLHEGSWSDR